MKKQLLFEDKKSETRLQNCSDFSLLRIIATLRSEPKLAAVSRDTHEKAGNGQSQKTFVPGMTEEYTTEVSEEMEDRIT